MEGKSHIWNSPRLRKYRGLVREDLAATYSRNLHEWLIIAPVIGVITGLVITLVAKIILVWMWPRVFQAYLAHPAWIVPGLAIGFALASARCTHTRFRFPVAAYAAPGLAVIALVLAAAGEMTPSQREHYLGIVAATTPHPGPLTN